MTGRGDFALARYEGGSVLGHVTHELKPPTISGNATEGQTLTVNPGAWSGSTPITHTYQWRRCDSAGANCVDIAAATATTYALAAADVGHTIRVRETATNAYGRLGRLGRHRRGQGEAGQHRRHRPKLKNGAAIANASVNCGSGYSAKTAGDGTYSIPNVAPGTYSCTASANRYAPATRTVTVTSGQTSTVNFNLARS